MADPLVVPIGWERAALAAEKVKERLRRATSALAQGVVPYAVVGGNAVADYVGRVDEGAVRNTVDVDILVRRSDFDAAKAALEAAGFVHAVVRDIDVFLDGPNGRPRDAIHFLYAREKVRPEYTTASPDVIDSEAGPHFQVVSLPALVIMKLSSFRDKDRTHLRDMIEVGLVDQTWTTRLPIALASRLQQLLDTPGG